MRRRVHMFLIVLSCVFLMGTMTANATVPKSPPRARNYGFDSGGNGQDIDTEDEAAFVSDQLDSAGYGSYSCPSQPAHYAYDRMEENAVFTFEGHGLVDPWDQQLGYGLYFSDNHADFPTHPLLTRMINDYGTNTVDKVYFERFQSALEDMLLAVNVGCGTAASNAHVGDSITKKMWQKGASCSIGFYANIDLWAASKWYKTFFVYAENNSSFSNSASWAIDDTYDYSYQELGYYSYGGIDSCMVYGTGVAHLKPARYGQ